VRGALVAPGPSLDDYPDLDEKLHGYDIRIGIAEAVLHTRELDYLTLFDPKARKKVEHVIWPELTIITDADFESPLTQARSGSLGRALGFCRILGIQTLDLYGVDLCVRDRNAKYSSKTEENMRVDYQTPQHFEVDTEGNICPSEFWIHARQIEQHHKEWEDMDIQNLNPRSALRAFPRGPR